ncbi:MAG: FadR/GntR family transcriptional regulator [Actinomycetota bacterium]|nr:FadR/GntR family transcriptional regulator [Actinomycetota bacterium]
MDYFKDIRPIEKFLVIDQIIDKIANLIEEGYLKPGDFLPGERILAEKLGVSRTSLRQALKALDFLGILEIAPGKKTFIKNSSSEMLRNPFRFIKAFHSIKIEEILETRRIIEEGLVQIAAKKIKKGDIEKINDLLKKCEENLDNTDEFVFSEFKFHQCIFNIADNKILTTTMDSLNNLLIVIEKYEKDYLTKEDRIVSFKQHKKISDALKDKDSEKARDAMRAHLKTMELRFKNIDR